jgi:Flp pilus assembly protein TadD
MIRKTRSLIGAAALAFSLPLAFGCTPDGKKTEAASTGASPEAATPATTSVETPITATPATSTTAIPANVSFDDAHSAFTAGRYQEAVTLFTGYTANHPHNPWGYYMLGLSTWKAGDRTGAEVAFNTALTLEPTHERSLFNSARVLLEDGRTEDALARIEKGIDQNPTSGEGYRLLGRARYQLSQVDPAIEAYQEALVLDEKDVWAMNNLGLIYIQQGRFEEALPALARAVELKSGSPVFQNNLGVALERTGHYGDAAKAYQAALAADSGYQKASIALARVNGLADPEGLTPVDLVALSGIFQGQIQDWQSVTPASADESEDADSTGTTGEVAKQTEGGTRSPQQ